MTKRKRRYYRTGTYKRVSERDFDLLTLPIRMVYAPVQLLTNLLAYSPSRAKRIRDAEDELVSYSERRQRRFEQRYKEKPPRKRR